MAQGLGAPGWPDGLRDTLRRGATSIGSALPRVLRRIASSQLWRPAGQGAKRNTHKYNFQMLGKRCCECRAASQAAHFGGRKS